jgi:acylphosphatase
VFEGPADDVLTLVNWCMTGPPLASVTDIEVIEEPPTGLAAFHIR